MRLSRYLITEDKGPRSVSIPYEKADSLIKEKCGDIYDYYMNNGDLILRGLERMDDCLLINPSATERRSKGLKNYYTYIIDNHPKWSKFPKRSRSIICATNRIAASAFGRVFIVFPFNGSDIAQIAESDLWQAFRNDVGSLNQFTLVLDDLFEGMLNKVIKFDKTYQVFRKSIKELQEAFDENPDKFYDIVENIHAAASALEMWRRYRFKPGMDIWKYLLDRFNPPTGAKVVKAGDKLRPYSETWTDGKCVLMHESVWQTYGMGENK